MADNKKTRIKNIAQTASELAIFGGILIFVIGAMIRSSMNSNFNQNQSLKALRLALRASLDSSMDDSDSLNNGTGNTSRSYASLLFLEDRITPDANKYGALSRTPYIMPASGIFSKNLFKNPDWLEPALPLYDMYINGKHLVLATAGYREYDVRDVAGQPPSIAGVTDFVPIDPRKSFWDKDCLNGQGCRIFYTITADLGTKNPKFCSSGCPVAPPEAASAASYLTEDQRFDLHRDGPIDDVPVADRAAFAWQWLGVAATTKNVDVGNGKNVVVDVDGDLKEEQIMEVVDREGKVWNMDKVPEDDYPDTPIDIVRVLDSQAGDIDATHNTYDILPSAQGGKTLLGMTQPGLTNDMQMYSFDRDGTYLAIQEGKPYNPSNNEVRSIQKKNRVDIVQRTILLSNDTGRFCPRDPRSKDADGVPYNPDVEVCAPDDGGCFEPANVYKTCFDKNTHLLFVRSRLLDTRGRKWMTNVTP